MTVRVVLVPIVIFKTAGQDIEPGNILPIEKGFTAAEQNLFSKMEVNIMQCSSCEKTHSEDEKWYSCPECGKVLCLECAEGKEKKEVAILKKIREGDAHTRLELLCPSCGTGMFSPR